jgi:hypothetical protein
MEGGKRNEVGHHKSHMKSPGIEPDALRLQVSVYQPKLWYQVVFHKCNQYLKVFKCFKYFCCDYWQLLTLLIGVLPLTDIATNHKT